MSFYKDNTSDFYLGEPQVNWSFKNYAEKIGQTMVLYISEEPVSMKHIPKGTVPENKHLIASRLTHIETIDDPKEPARIVYLLIFDSGLQVIMNSAKTDEDQLENVLSYLSPPAPVKRARATAKPKVEGPAASSSDLTGVSTETEKNARARRQTRGRASPVEKVDES